MYHHINADSSAIALHLLLNQYIDKAFSIIQDDIPVKEWRIYHYSDLQKFNFFNNLPNNMFGCCYIDEKKIWISNRTLMMDEDFSINVIIHELTHLKTGKGHNDAMYQKQYAAYCHRLDIYKKGREPFYYNRLNLSPILDPAIMPLIENRL
ncbi:hypothetical protein SPFL3102_02290 [Sporomusaceae bacterium FL31]|nr:hypothetical protein SPFL3101_02294 [Sporomusaceae bacterium FL31]GCE34478.1 hypothetical protein SPFL3102_02290 [Sporomusaceae bacterium]